MNESIGVNEKFSGESMIGNQQTVAILFGGCSTEHEVSLKSALGILNHVNRRKYSVVLIKISRDGRWMLLDDIEQYGGVEELEKAAGRVVVTGDPHFNGFMVLDGPSREPLKVDVVFPVLHGRYGEDGTVQGLMSLADLPCVGAGVLSSALGMDKIMMKQVFFQNDIPAVDFMWFLRRDWRDKRKQKEIREGIAREIGYPCFVKPANTGSSVGVFKVPQEEKLAGCLDAAAAFDRKILVEKAVDARELECAVLGNDEPLASVVGEIIPANEFYDYQAKYFDKRSRTIIPAEVDVSVSTAVRRMAVQVFKALDCAGMGRVDFLLDRKNGGLYVNEINTLPGFTPISMYPKLWEATGTSFEVLIDRLVELAAERHADIAGAPVDPLNFLTDEKTRKSKK
jgi:D-alanine-D-alanine ligase